MGPTKYLICTSFGTNILAVMMLLFVPVSVEAPPAKNEFGVEHQLRRSQPPSAAILK